MKFLSKLNSKLTYSEQRTFNFKTKRPFSGVFAYWALNTFAGPKRGSLGLFLKVGKRKRGTSPKGYFLRGLRNNNQNSLTIPLGYEDAHLVPVGNRDPRGKWQLSPRGNTLADLPRGESPEPEARKT